MTSVVRVPKHKLPCAYHLSAQAIGACVVCGHGVCHGCHTHEPRGRLVCAACRQALILAHGPSWERPQTNWMLALSETATDVVRSPGAFFSRLPPQTSPLAGWVFGSMFVAAGMMLCVIWEVAALSAPLPRSFGPTSSHPQSIQHMALFLRVPLLSPMLVLLHASILWGILRAARKHVQWGQVLRICGYSSVAYLLCVVPHIAGFPVGVFLALLVQNNLVARGLHTLYGISPVWARVYTLVPVVLNGALFFL